jgi:hypothetical protein
MNQSFESGEQILLTGKSGERYRGKIYTEKESQSSISGRAIAMLSNSVLTEQGWEHQVNSVYNTEDVGEELAHFRTRDDISHLILLPYAEMDSSVPDKVDDLIRSYVHK